MEMHLRLSLPRDELSLPVARHLCRYTLGELGVVDGCKTDVELALAEACTNVLDHGGDGRSYDVQLAVDSRTCVIRVIDTGGGFDPESAQQAGDDSSAESGRGLDMMRALVDRVRFVSKPEAGTIVHLEKDLEFLPGTPAARLAT